MDGRQVRIAAALLAGSLSAASAAHADTSFRQLDGDRVMVTDFSGKPPFERRIVSIDELSAADQAKLESPAPSAALVGAASPGIAAAGLRSRPPFRRDASVESAQAARFARFEEVSETETAKETETVKRRGAPGKPFSRR